jgi:hypothetical protein
VFSDRKAIVRQFVDELGLDEVDAAASMSPGANNPVTERFLGVENRRCKRAAWRRQDAYATFALGPSKVSVDTPPRGGVARFGSYIARYIGW